MGDIARATGVGRATLYRRFPDPDTVVDSLLAPLAPEVYQYQRHQRGKLPRQITDSLSLLARRLVEVPVRPA